jgi:hypothetical protein
MKTFFGIAILFIWLFLWLFLVYATLLGLYLAFSASVLLGFAVLLVEPAPLVIGIASIFWGANLAESILAAFS